MKQLESYGYHAKNERQPAQSFTEVDVKNSVSTAHHLHMKQNSLNFFSCEMDVCSPVPWSAVVYFDDDFLTFACNASSV